MTGEWKEVKRRNKGSVFDRLGREQGKHKESRFEELCNVSVTVYVSNFLVTVGSRDLWQLCDRHGSVADVYIAWKLSKSGHRFTFVRFVKIPDSNMPQDTQSRILTKVAYGMKHTEHANGNQSYATAVKGNSDNLKAQSDKVLLKKIVLNQSNLLVIPDTSCVVLAKIQHVLKTFKMDERIVWVELDGLPLSAWTSNAFKKVTGWVPDFDAIDDNSQKEWARNNSDSDEDEQSIHINDEAVEGKIKENNKDEENIDVQVDEVKDTERDQTNESKSVIKPTWAEEINNLEAKENVIFEKDEEINKDRDQEVSNSPSKPLGFEGFRSSTSTFNHGKKKSRANSANSHFNARGSQSGKRRSTCSLIDAFISHIKMGSVLGYDMEGSKADLKKCINSIGVHGSLQETHVQRIDLFKIKRLWGNYQFDFASSSAIGRSGGLLSIWDSSIFIKANIFSMENLLIVEGEWVFKKMKCFMVNVYAPQEERKKKDLWNFIRNFMSDQPGHYFVFGDFNVVRFSSERIGSLFNHRSASNFNEFIKDCRFWDVPLGGHAFTRISGNGEKLSRLDRFLLSEDVTNIVPNLMVVSLDRLISDHRPIILMQSNVDFGPTPFKFYNSWLSILDFDGMVTKVWDQSHADIERDLEAGLGSSSLHSQRKDLLLKIRDIERAESLDAYQKAKIKWGIEADENTKFFHGIVKKKRRDLAINGVMKNRTWFFDPRDIKDIFREFFVKKFKHFKGVDVTRRSDHYKTLSSAQVSLLEHSISEREVYDAIRDYGSEKSLGPDGFSFAFYKKYWDILKTDIMAYVREFFENGNIPSGCNSSFITLIPKVDNLLVVSDFRPISLIGAQYKILAKILANRLSCVFDSVISPEQTAFIKIPQILDGFMGFGCRLRGWIQGCLNSAKASVLINGSPSPEFSLHRGLRQGDPLSPFLFILTVKDSSSLLSFLDLETCGLGDIPLERKFPRLFCLEANKDCLVRDKWQNGWVWCWTRNFNGGVTGSQLDSLISMLVNVHLTDGNDAWHWSLIGSNIFMIRDTRIYIDSISLLDFPIETRWCRFIPRKVNILVWRALRDRTPTRWNLSRKGIEVPSLLCPLCNISPETSAYLFWSCSMVTSIWSLVFKWIDLTFPDANNLNDVFKPLRLFCILSLA
ncbi:RNA-directed DNA polymerase, eukaryota [Tanacetum coccineum]